MYKKTISKEMLDFLLSHIAEIEKEKDVIIKECYDENVEKGIDMENFFKEYTNAINEYIKNSHISSENKDDDLFVTIGSIVEVDDVEEKETYKYRIVLPYTNFDDDNIDNASCLSPLGKSLLLKKLNQKVDVKIPTGILKYVVKNIINPAV